MLGFNDTSTLVGHFASSPREREKRDRRDRKDEREGQGRKWNRNEWEETEEIQEAHGPRFAHLSDIATADMQMLCNIFPVLSSQLMKISSFEQFVVLKKNIWA